MSRGLGDVYKRQLPNRTKEDENKTFVQLFIYAGLAILILIVLCSTIYVPLANLLHGA